MRISVTSTLAGLTLAGGGVAIAAGVGFSPSYWPAPVWLAAAGLVVAGATVVGRPTWRRPAAAAALVFGVQAAGAGTVAVRDWFNAKGAGLVNLNQRQLATVVTIAAAVAMAGAVAACLAVALLWREPTTGWAALSPHRPIRAIAAVAMGTGPPLIIAFTANSDALTTAGSLALTYTLPWAAGLAVAAWLGPRAARAAAGAVLACAVAVLVGS
jgi:hypothetical protein